MEKRRYVGVVERSGKFDPAEIIRHPEGTWEVRAFDYDDSEDPTVWKIPDRTVELGTFVKGEYHLNLGCTEEDKDLNEIHHPGGITFRFYNKLRGDL